MKLYLLKIYLHLLEWYYRITHPKTCSPPTGPNTRNIKYAPHPLQALDIICPPIPSNGHPTPILLYIHGGGWITGDKRRATALCKIFASQGYLVVNTNYRLAPQHPFPAPVQDVAAALTWIADHAQQYNADPARTAIAGDSAGAHLAATLAAAHHNPEFAKGMNLEPLPPNITIRALLLFYGIFDTQGFIDCGFPSAQTFVNALLPNPQLKAQHPHASPVRHLTKDFPPTYLAAGQPDPLAIESQHLASKLDTLNVPHQHTHFTTEDHPNATHGFINYFNRPCTQTTLQQAREFLQKHATL